MKEAEPRLAAEVQRWLAQAAQTDKAEDRQFGASKRGDEMPEWMAIKEKRLEKIRPAKAALEKAALEAEAKAKAASKPDDDGSGDGGKGRPGRKSKPVPAEPSDKAQRNFCKSWNLILQFALRRGGCPTKSCVRRYAAGSNFSLAMGSASRKVCIGVLP